MFSGEFDTILIPGQGAPTIIDAEAGIIVPPKNFTELDRLSCTVRNIDHMCGAIPKGALKYTPLQKMTGNEGFKGISVEDACDLANWQHFREVEQTAKKELIARN